MSFAGLSAPEPAALRPADAGPMNVTAIGSCRVSGPLRRATDQAPFRLNQTGIYGYCHSSAEALQQAEILHGVTHLPKGLDHLLAPSGQSAARHVPSHLYFVELSSAKVLTVDGVAIQLNYFSQHFNEILKDPTFARAYWRLARDGSASAMREFLSESDRYQQLPRNDRYVLANLRLTISTPASLGRDIEALASLLGDVVFVTHFSAQSGSGLLRARQEYIEMLRDVLSERQVTFYDPSEHVARFGQREALESDGASLTHYSETFQNFLCETWSRTLIEPRAAKRRPSQLRSLPASEPPEAALAATG